MLKNILNSIPQIVLLRSDKVLIHLITNLLGKEILEENKFPEVLDGVRDFYPNSYRLDEIELTLSQKSIIQSDISSDFDFKNFKGVDYNFHFLGKLYKKFFTQDGVFIYAKEEKLEEYLSFITKVSPLQIIGYNLTKELEDKKINERDVYAFAKAYTPLGLQVDKLNKYAENHLHLKGSGYLAFNFIKLFSYSTPKKYYKKEFLQEIPRINEFSFINNHSISIGQLVDVFKHSKEFIYSSFMDDSLKHKEAFTQSLQQIMVTNNSLGHTYSYSIENMSQMNKIFPIFKNSTCDNLCREIVKFYDEDDYSKAYLLENILFFYIYNTTNSSFLQKILKLYFHANNILRSYMLMSQNLGLSHFSEFSGSNLREVERRNAHNTARSIINSGTTHLNAKIGGATTADKLQRNIGDFKNAFDKEKSRLAFNFGLSPQAKGREKASLIVTGNLHPQFYKKRLKIKEESLAIDDFVRNVKYKMVNKFQSELKYTQIEAYKNKKELENQTFDLSSYVVSIDAVGKETHTPPEVYAPFFRYLRNAPKRLKNNIFLDTHAFEHHKNLLITVHAGEDFNHIVTGMRRVDESMYYFNMQRRDRLGHVLSLGIRPKDWLESVQEVVLYKGDYFDDLVWLCHKLKSISCRELDLSRYISLYEEKVWRLFKELHPMHSGDTLHISDLYDAWKYRKNCPITYYKRKADVTIFDEYSRQVLDEKKPCAKVAELFELYHSNKELRRKREEVVCIEKSKIKKEELKVWEALQDKLLNKISKKGIIIETNPSSNVFISSLSSYAYHPIFRFNPPKEKYLKKWKKFNKYGQRNGRVSITINSDDPAIFVTSLQNEYRTIKNIAKENYNCSDKEADDWLKDIRLFGVEVFMESDKS